MKKYSVTFMLTLVLCASALTCALMIGAYYLFQSRPTAVAPDPVSEYRALIQLIEELYIGEFDTEEINHAAMRAAVESLGDPWSYYMTPDEYADYLDRSKNRYAGIGVGVAYDEVTTGVLILYVYKGSAADIAGLAANDIIIGVDGEDIYGLGIDGLRALLERELGATADIAVLRPDGSTKIFTVEYNYVFVDPVSFSMLDDNIGYVSLVNFDEGAADRFISAVNELIEQGALAFVFDVRSNNGGRVSEMTRILDFLLPEGEIFISVDRSMQEDIIYSDMEMIDMPAVVLVNSQSYSAAEYFAATLREYGYAEVIGEQTTGKNRMQITLSMPGGGALHISSSQYLTRNRVSLFDTGGLMPDWPVLLSDEEYALFISGNLSYNDDPQVLKALEVIGDKLNMKTLAAK